MSGDTVSIPLTQGQFALVSACDAARVLAHKWCASKSHGGKFRAVSGTAVPTLMHRFILNPPDGMVIDHIDDNPLNNTRGNLRICTNQQNIANGNWSTGSTGYRGIFKDKRPRKKPWKARICVHQKMHYLGSYETAEAAARAYDQAALKYFGEFARLNFPD